MVLAHQVHVISNSSDMRIVGAVAIDALAPQWVSWREPRPQAVCNCDAPLHDPYGFVVFWKYIKTASPTGLVRLLYASGLGGYDVVMKMYPSDVQGEVLGYSMRRKFFDTAVLEAERFDINCGYARRGEAILGHLLAFEVIVVPNDINLTALALLNPRSNVTITPGPPEDEHAGIILHKDYAPIVTQALLRVIHKTSAYLTET